MNTPVQLDFFDGDKLIKSITTTFLGPVEINK
jgi:hypothetical protein